MATSLWLVNDTFSGWQQGDNFWRAGDNNASRHLDFAASGSVRVLTALRRLEATEYAGTGTTISANTTTGPTSGVPFSTTQAWMSRPLAADITISGTINFDICGLESNMSANAGFQVKVWRIDETGKPHLIINSEHGTELGTTLGRMSWTGTPTSTAMKKGNRILVQVFLNDVGTMASGHTGTLRYAGSNANTADSKVTFAENLTFITTNSLSGTVYYLRSTAHGSISNAKLMSTTAGSSTTTAVHTTVAGPATYPGDEWTDTAGGNDVRWYTPPLNAFTLGGLVYVKVPAGQGWEAGTGNSPHDISLIEIAVCDADGSNAVIAGASYQQPQTGGLNGGAWVLCQDTAVGQGQIIRARWLQADGASNASAGTNRTMSYNNNAAANADIHLQFTQTITEASASTPVSVGGASTTPGGALVKDGRLRPSAATTPGGVLAKAMAKLASAATTPVGTAVKQIGKLINQPRNNHALRTETLSDWVTQLIVDGGTNRRRSIYTVGVSAGTADSTVAPDGTTTAEAMMETAGGTQHLREGAFHQAFLPAGELVYYSDHFKAGLGRDWVALGVYDGRNGQWWFAWFDVANGVVGHKDSGFAASGIEASPNGWYRPWVRYVAGTGVGTDHIYPGAYIATSDGAESGTPGDGANRPLYSGDVTKGLYVWGAMWDLFATRLNPYLPNLTGNGIAYADSTMPVGTLASSKVSVVSVGAASTTPVGLLMKAIAKIVGASTTPSATTQPIKQTAKVVGAAGTTPVGGAVKQVNKIASASTTPTGALARSLSFARAVGDAITTPTATLVKLVNKFTGGGATPSGTLAQIRQLLKTAGGASTTPTGTAVKEVRKITSGDVPSSGQVVKTAQKQAGGTTTPTGALSLLKAFSRAVGAAVTTPVGALMKLVGKNPSGATTPTGTNVKLVSKFAGGSTTPAGDLDHEKTGTNVNVGAVTTPVGGLQKLVNKIVGGSTTPSGNLLYEMISTAAARVADVATEIAHGAQAAVRVADAMVEVFIENVPTGFSRVSTLAVEVAWYSALADIKVADLAVEVFYKEGIPDWTGITPEELLEDCTVAGIINAAMFNSGIDVRQVTTRGTIGVEIIRHRALLLQRLIHIWEGVEVKDLDVAVASTVTLSDVSEVVAVEARRAVDQEWERVSLVALDDTSMAIGAGVYVRDNTAVLINDWSAYDRVRFLGPTVGLVPDNYTGTLEPNLQVAPLFCRALKLHAQGYLEMKAQRLEAVTHTRKEYVEVVGELLRQVKSQRLAVERRFGGNHG